MKFKIHYHITKTRGGLPQSFEGARIIEADSQSDAESVMIQNLSVDYEVNKLFIELTRADIIE